jgi:hypothetical protein
LHIKFLGQSYPSSNLQINLSTGKYANLNKVKFKHEVFLKVLLHSKKQ